MRHILFTVLTLLALVGAPKNANANGPWQRFFQDGKFPSQAVLERDFYAMPLGASTTQLGAAVAISSVANTTITSFSAQPDYVKNVTLTPTGTTSHVAAGTAVVTGMNIFGKTITENFAIASAQATATTGNSAFKSVSSVVFPVASGTGVTLSIGTGVKLGVRRCLNEAGKYVFSEFNNAYETTRGTMAADATHVESNTFTPNGSMNGIAPVEVFYIQNFRCFGN